MLGHPFHPGDAGPSLAAAKKAEQRTVHWVSAGRSARTRARAAKLGLRDAGSLAELCRRCAVIVSVCPPHAAEDVALGVLAGGFRGLYLEANAIAPGRAIRLGQALAGGGAAFVDGGIIGGPAWEPGRTYLSGPRAAEAAACFAAGPLETAVIGDTIGQASALKMCYSAYSKGTTALLCATLAAAEGLGVRATLERLWSRDDANGRDRRHV